MYLRQCALWIMSLLCESQVTEHQCHHPQYWPWNLNINLETITFYSPPNINLSKFPWKNPTQSVAINQYSLSLNSHLVFQPINPFLKPKSSSLPLPLQYCNHSDKEPGNSCWLVHDLQNTNKVAIPTHPVVPLTPIPSCSPVCPLVLNISLS